MAALMADPDFDAITLDGDEPAQAPKPKDQDLAAELEKLKTSLSQREAELADVRTKAFESEKQAYERARESADYKAQAAELQKVALLQTQKSLEAEEQALRNEHAKAIEVADGKTAAELASKLGDIAYQRNAVAAGLAEVEHVVSRATEERKRVPEPPKQRSNDPYDNDQFRAPPDITQRWLQDHKDRNYLGANGLAPKVLSAYYAAQDEGFREDSPAFYAHMDKVLGHSKQADADEGETELEAPSEPKPKAPQQKSKVGVAAPVSRSSASDVSAPRVGSNTRIKSEYADLAERLGMTPEEYAHYAYEATQKGSAESRAQAKAHYKQILR